MAADDQHDREDEEEAGSEDEHQKEKKEEYLGFRRKMDEFKGACEGMVSDSENYKKQGNAYFSFGCYSQATLMYSDAIDLQPHNHILYGNRAMAYLKQDMPELALVDAEKSLEIESSVDNIKSYWRKAQALLDMGKYEEADVAASEGLVIHGRNPHLNKVRRKAREAKVLIKLCAGDWVGKSNGIEQRRSFSKEGEMTISVFGQSIASTFELSIEGQPQSMVVRMKQQLGPGSPPPAQPMVYIFEFHDDDKELWLCHPVGTTELPTSFEGPGFMKNRRVEKGETVDTPIECTGPLDERCNRYMREMIELIPEMVRQLPEKPTDDQIKEEVEMCGRISTLKKKYGPEVHQRAVELAKAPATADDEGLKELAEQLRRRFLARKFISEDKPAAPKPASNTSAAAEATLDANAEAAVLVEQDAIVEQTVAKKSKQSSTSCLSSLVTRVCGDCGRST